MERVNKDFYMGYITWIAQHYNDHSVHITDAKTLVYRGEGINKRQVAESISSMDNFKINQPDKEGYESSYRHFLELDIKSAYPDKEFFDVLNRSWSYFKESGHVKTDWMINKNKI